jgi:hypothetical protein
MNKFVVAAIAIFALLLIYLAFTCTGTGDDGDAVYHYLYGHYAFKHPENFLNHWAKPLFVMATAPFSYFGFTAIKLFNIAVTCTTIWLTYRVADELEVPNPWISALIMMFSNMYVVNTLSGLTEPMFALWLVFGVYLYIKDKPIQSVLWISFLPFVRSEGLIIFCVFVVFLLIQRQWKLLPLLAVGHAVMSVVGWFYYKDFSWVFTKMSYATTEAVYGKGELTHFFTELRDVIHLNICWIWLAGMLAGLIYTLASLFKVEIIRFTRKEVWLVYGIFTAYFIAHSLFWYWGVFASYGLMRVMIGVLPMMAIIINRGINFLAAPFGMIHSKGARFGAIGIFIFCAASAIYGFNPGTLELNATQNAQIKAKDALTKAGYTNTNARYYVDAINYCHTANIDVFDENVRRSTKGIFTNEPIPKNTVVIWDDLFSAFEVGPLSKLMNDKRLKLFGSFSGNDHIFWTEHYVYVFVRDTSDLKTLTDADILYKNDFEKEPKPLSIIPGFNSKHCQVLSPNNLFVNCVEGTLSSFAEKKQVQVQAQIYLNAFHGTDFEVPKLIFSYENKGVSYNWKQVNIQPLVSTLKTWTPITVTEVVDAPRDKDDVLKVYFVFQGKEPYYVDDLVIKAGG